MKSGTMHYRKIADCKLQIADLLRGGRAILLAICNLKSAIFNLEEGDRGGQRGG
jgi:hypothetical protein